VTPATQVTVREYCLAILESGDLATKLLPPRTSDGKPLDDTEPGPAVRIDQPERDATLTMRSGASSLPKLTAMREVSARTVCMERFAHHELMAVELFAWALVTFPEAPPALRRSILGVIADEQRHLSMYLERLEDFGSGLGQTKLSDYLWKHAPAIRDASDGLLAFLCAMGLTFEQANLDFTALYGDAFRDAGDDPSAAIVDRIHRDEIGHVRVANEWMRRLKDPSLSDADAYRQAVPFPLGPSRAKGRQFDIEARRAAGLDEQLIELVRTARPGDDRPAS
jgi:uncharacterized ferritin-like protein (DUF455 family)